LRKVWTTNNITDERIKGIVNWITEIWNENIFIITGKKIGNEDATLSKYFKSNSSLQNLNLSN
jgi:hypothetical protein